ncbi:hypothetical protein L0156_20195 [bacterium]|nr:hypothetical protein [bacterium]
MIDVHAIRIEVTGGLEAEVVEKSVGARTSSPQKPDRSTTILRARMPVLQLGPPASGFFNKLSP